MKVNWKIVKDILKPTSTASIIGGVLIAAAISILMIKVAK